MGVPKWSFGTRRGDERWEVGVVAEGEMGPRVAFAPHHRHGSQRRTGIAPASHSCAEE